MANSKGRVAGKVALVTGGASGLGAESARLLAAEGASIMLTDRAADAGQAIADEIAAAGGKVHFMAQDVVDEARWIEVVAETRRRWQEAAGSPAEFTELHRHLATQALDAMRKELADMKKAALTLPAPPPPRFPSPDPAPTLAP